MWPHVRDKIRAAVERTELSSFADIEADVLSGMQLCWIAWDGNDILAAATTQLVKPYDKVCVLTACSGYDRAQWLPQGSRPCEDAKVVARAPEVMAP